MIFVTVGTHEDPFDRLIKKIDEIAKQNPTLSFIVQTGYSTYEPKYVSAKQFFPYDEMIEITKQSKVVITHGGPGSIMVPLSMNIPTIVVPRQKQYGEHVDDHQIYFCQRLEKEGKVACIMDIQDLDIQLFEVLKKDVSIQRPCEEKAKLKIIVRLDEIVEKYT